MLKRKIKELFGIYKTGVTYTIPFDEIVVTKDFLLTQIGKEKWGRKLRYYDQTGMLQSKIKLTKDFVLVDGYSSYCIARAYWLKEVPVEFVEYIDR